MKKKIFVIAMLGIGMISCGKSEQNTVAEEDTVATVVEEPKVDTPVTAEETPAEESAAEADIAMIKEFYKKCVFGTSSPKKYCTAQC